MNAMAMRRQSAQRMRTLAHEVVKHDKHAALDLLREANVMDDETDQLEKKFNRRFIKRDFFNAR